MCDFENINIYVWDCKQVEFEFGPKILHHSSHISNKREHLKNKFVQRASFSLLYFFTLRKKRLHLEYWHCAAVLKRNSRRNAPFRNFLRFSKIQLNLKSKTNTRETGFSECYCVNLKLTSTCIYLYFLIFRTWATCLQISPVLFFLVHSITITQLWILVRITYLWRITRWSGSSGSRSCSSSSSSSSSSFSSSRSSRCRRSAINLFRRWDRWCGYICNMIKS